jgi:tRNA (guanine-N7-)-methyltransferase
LPLDVLAPYLLELPDPPAPIEWSAVFGNDHPVELEVGFGKGLFLITSAQAYPGTNYVGVEIDRALQLYVATRAAKRTLRNIRLVRADARLFVRTCVPLASLRAIHVYFPDPWWKKRHKKRRVFTEEFAAACAQALEPGGRLHIATDVEEYFGVMTQLVAAHTLLRPLPPPAHGMDYLTNFERKARLAGQPVWRASYVKDPPAG